MSPPLDELYFTWLCNQVGDTRVKNPNRTYWGMLKQLFLKEFVWVIPKDDNRIQDGKDLRYEFVDQSGLGDVDPGWINLGCSVLELIIGLSRRLSFEIDGEPRDCFWELINNLSLGTYLDSRPFQSEEVEEILDRFIWRTYSFDGKGGLFPLKNPDEDQTKIELWYQLCAYVLEKD
jgi:hypothetical protein